MPSSEIVDELIAYFRSSATTLGAGASSAEVERFAQERHVTLPRELVMFFELCNGTNGDYAPGMICFWSLNQLKALDLELSGPKRSLPALIHSAYSDPIGEYCRFYVFADFMHEAQLYAIRLGSEGTVNDVIVLDGEHPRVVATSFAQFLDRFMHAPALIGAEAD